MLDALFVLTNVKENGSYNALKLRGLNFIEFSHVSSKQYVNKYLANNIKIRIISQNGNFVLHINVSICEKNKQFSSNKKLLMQNSSSTLNLKH